MHSDKFIISDVPFIVNREDRFPDRSYAPLFTIKFYYPLYIIRILLFCSVYVFMEPSGAGFPEYFGTIRA